MQRDYENDLLASRQTVETSNADTSRQLLLADCMVGPSSNQKNPADCTGPPVLCFARGDEGNEKPKISDDTVKGYIESFKNLKDNGAANQETLDAFKKSVKALQDLDPKALEKELQDASKNPKVEMMLVAMHLKEVMQASGFKPIASDLQRKEGSIVMKHDDSETYVSLQYSSNAGKEGAKVSIEKKK